MRGSRKIATRLTKQEHGLWISTRSSASNKPRCWIGKRGIYIVLRGPLVSILLFTTPHHGEGNMAAESDTTRASICRDFVVRSFIIQYCLRLGTSLLFNISALFFSPSRLLTWSYIFPRYALRAAHVGREALILITTPPFPFYALRVRPSVGWPHITKSTVGRAPALVYLQQWRQATRILTKTHLRDTTAVPTWKRHRSPIHWWVSWDGNLIPASSDPFLLPLQAANFPCVYVILHELWYLNIPIPLPCNGFQHYIYHI